jgi:hypothetical protein
VANPGAAAGPSGDGRHRIKRFEGLAGGSIGEQPTAIELWWALQARQLTGR